MTTREMVINPLKVATVLGAALLLWGVLLALTSSPAHAVPSSSCSTADGTTSCTFDPTGAEATFKVPAGVSSVHVVATGAPGGTAFGPASGGRGAQVSGDLTVTPDDTLYVNVGGAPASGGCAEISGDPAECVGGFNGGIDDDGPAGGGGGGSNLVPAGGTAANATGGPSITISYVTPKKRRNKSEQIPPLVELSGRTRLNTNYVQLDKPVSLCNPSLHLRAK